MATLTLKEVLQKAIEKEIESRCLYAELSQQVESEVAKNTFQKLAQQEQWHQSLLEQYLRGELKEGVLSSGQGIDYKIAEHLDQPEIFPGMKLKEIFLLAANREKASHELYLGLALIHTAGEVKKLLEELAMQELEHKRKMEFLYSEVAFPQTDGG